MCLLSCLSPPSTLCGIGERIEKAKTHESSLRQFSNWRKELKIQAVQRLSLSTFCKRTAAWPDSGNLLSFSLLIIPGCLLYPSFFCQEWHGMEHPFGLFRSAVLAMPYANLLATSSLLTVVRKEKAMILCKHCSATVKTLLCYQHWFSHRSKIQL